MEYVKLESPFCYYGGKSNYFMALVNLEFSGHSKFGNINLEKIILQMTFNQETAGQHLEGVLIKDRSDLSI